MDLKKRVLTSAIWIGCGSSLANALKFFAKIILARLLLPTDFGLFAIILLFVNSFALLSDLGLGAAIIQRRKDIREAIHNAFSISLIVGCLLFFISFILAPKIALFFNEQILVGIMRLFSFGFIFLAIELVPSSLLIKELEFGKKVFIEFLAVTTFFIISLLLAYFGQGIWSLAYGQFCSMFINSLGMFIISGFRPKIDFNLKICYELLAYGKDILLIGVIGFLLVQGDDIFVGRYLGTLALGYYLLAYSIANMPSKTISFVISSLTFPIFAKLQQNKSSLRQAYLKILEWSYFLILPISFGLFIIAPEFVKIILGNKWLPSIPVLQILCLFTLSRSFHHIGGYFFQAIGNPKLHRNLSFFELAGIAILIYPLSLRYGIFGTGVAVTTVLSMGALYLFWRIRKEVNLSNFEDIKILSPQIAISILMTLSIFILKHRIFKIIQLPELIFLIGFGIVFYLVLSGSFLLTNKKQQVYLNAACK